MILQFNLAQIRNLEDVARFVESREADQEQGGQALKMARSEAYRLIEGTCKRFRFESLGRQQRGRWLPASVQLDTVRERQLRYPAT